MKLTLLTLLLASLSLCEEQKKPELPTPEPVKTFEQLQASNALLKAQLETLQAILENETASCWNLDLMQSRFKAATAQKKLQALEGKQKAEKPKAEPAPKE